MTKNYFPGQQGNAWVAYHGSWNSTKRVGYRVESILFDPATGQPCGSQMIVSTLSADGKDALARPVDCAEAPDGSVLFTSDAGAAIYRITYTGMRTAPVAWQPVPLQQSPDPKTPTIAVPVRKVATVTEFAPLNYFASNCARCHGPNGSFYGATFGHKLTDEQLQEVVKAMGDGPGNAPLQGEPLAIVVAYHHSLVDKRPFLVLSHIEGEGTATMTLTGEVSPGSAVKVLSGDRSIEAKVDNQNWTVVLPGTTDLARTRLMAENAGQQTVVEVSESTYSHRQPLPKPITQ